MKTIIRNITIIMLVVVHFNSFGQNRNSTREQTAANKFYPASKSELESQLESLFNAVDNKTTAENINAIIVPDDKLSDAGAVTASAISKLNREKEFTRIFVIGTSHGEPFEGFSVYSKGDYRTPLGIVRIDNEVVYRLIYNNRTIKYYRKAHRDEHSVEVQLPYLQYWLNNPFKIVPMVVGEVNKQIIEELTAILEPYFKPDNLFIISSDIANSALDAASANELIRQNDVENLIENLTESSDETASIPKGWGSVVSLLSLTSENEKISIEHIQNSNASNSSATGYQSFIVKNSTEPVDTDIQLTQEDMQFLITLVRQSIRQKQEDNSVPEVNEEELSDNLKKNLGAFVSLTINDELRGKMGKFSTTDPLYKVVQEMAIASAFRDQRYTPVSANEMGDIDIEITVLTPLKQIFSSDEIQMGKHGIFMTTDGRNGSFLPETARTTRWSKEEFLGYCAEDIIGIGWDGWRTADLYTFETFVFNRRTANRR